MDETRHDPESDFERLLADCIERIGRDGLTALAAVQRAHPEFAARLADRIDALRTSGLLPVAEAGGAILCGQFRVVGTLGRGAMGVVYLADPLEGGARVAVKVCSFAGGDPQRARERFLREARAAMRLDHPHIVPVLAVVEEGDAVFLVMEAVEGATLAEVLAEVRAEGTAPGALGVDHLVAALARCRPAAAVDAEAFGRTWVEAVCRILRDIARALHHVHSHGIVHRDVKPANILLDAQGRALLFDLGLARIEQDPALTRSGEFAGSPYYAAPEQVAGRRGAIDARTDVYALGVTLYESLALRVPFEADEPAVLFRRIATDDPPPLVERSPLVPSDLAVVCATALEKDAARRYATAAAFAEDLDSLLHLRPIVARAPGPLRRVLRSLRRRPAAAAALGLLGVLSIGGPLVLVDFNRRIAAERDEATRAAADYRREAERNLEVSEFWEELVVDLDASADESTRAAALEILRRGATWVGSERLEQPLSRALVLETLGRVHVQLGRAADALPLFDQALALRTGELSERHVETATALYHLARTHLELDHRGDARALAERAIAAFCAAGESAHGLVAQSLLVLADLDLREGAPQAARERCTAVLNLLRDGDDQAIRADALERLGAAAVATGDAEAAGAALAESLEQRRGARRPSMRSTATALALLARSRELAGDPASARELYREALGLRRRAFGDVHPAIAEILAALVPLLQGADDASPEASAFAGRCLLLLARNEAAGGADPLPVLDAAIARLRHGGPAGHADLAAALMEAGAAHLAAERVDDAEQAAARAIEVAVNGDVSGVVAVRGMTLLGDAALRRGDDEDAAYWFARALVDLDGDPSSTPGQRAAALLRIGEVRRRLGQPTADLERRAALLVLDPPPMVTPLLLDLDPTYPLRRGPPAAIAAYDQEFQRGITALQAGRPEQAIACFERCLELLPGVPICSYNIACAQLARGDRTAAQQALTRAVDHGFGFRSSDVALLDSDSDLVPLRGTPEFGVLQARVAMAREQAAIAAAEPECFVPAAAARHAALLVVVHRHGVTKESVVAGEWREVAQRLGMVLIAPSGPYRAVGGDTAEGGMTWVEDLARYERRAWLDDRPVVDAIAAARARFRIDPARVYLAGEGLGGIIAFDVAMRAPSSFGGVLLHHATVHLPLARDHASALRSAGLRLVVVPEADRFIEGLAGSPAPPEHADELARVAASLGVDARVVPVGPRRPVDRLIEGMSLLLER